MSQSDMQAMDFANSMKMGRTTFFKKVKQVTGMPPHEYIRKMRLMRAAELLKDPTLSISEVAYQTGFEDPNYFSRNFKEYFGVTASQFRKGKPIQPVSD
jgi:AraC-like DNA-binding protein